MVLKDERVLLRDFMRQDIEKRLYWETVETEWQLWDGPWEYEGQTEEQRREAMARYIKKMEGWADRYGQIPEIERRWSFQICTAEGEYIGWCGAYRIGEDCECDPEGRRVAIGIDLPERQARGKGLATRALRLFMAYQYEQGERELYTQTWSGNERMIGLARKLGFEEYCRKAGVRTVRGKQYDGLTFRKML